MKENAEESTNSATIKLIQDQKIAPPDYNGSGCSAAVAVVNADDISGDYTSAETMAQSANAMERLSALKDAWENQDEEDMAYFFFFFFSREPTH